MPVDLTSLTDGWLELESDPGLFTLLLEDFGVKGIQVEEIYDLQKPLEGPVYGFIFLFKWISERRSRRKVVTEERFVENEDVINSMFFAQQVVPNSCATHALLSVLLNCSKIHLGNTLTRLKEYSKNMNPENKGYAIGNTPELAKAHNSHAKPQTRGPRPTQDKSHNIPTARIREAFHFVSYVPIDGHLFELDGLKPYPIDHGPWAENEDWTEKFRRVIVERLGSGGEPYHDIRFNLMAVVADKRIAYEQKLRSLKTSRQIVLEALEQLVKVTHPEITQADRKALVPISEEEKSRSKSKDSRVFASESTSSEATMPALSTPVKHPQQEGGCESQGSATDGGSPYPKLPPFLDSHNYAKSPLMKRTMVEPPPCPKQAPKYEEYSGSDYSDDNRLQARNSCTSSENLSTSPRLIKPLIVNTDIAKPLVIQTLPQSSPTPSSCSTETSSEVGSAFNSPILHRTAQLLPTIGNSSESANSECTASETALIEDAKAIKKFYVIRVTNEQPNSKENISISEPCESSKGEVDNPSTSKTESLVLPIQEPKCEIVCQTVKRCPSTDSLSSVSDILSKRPCLDDISSDSNTSGGQEVSRITFTAQDNKKSGESSLQDVQSKIQAGKTTLPNIESHKFAPKDLLSLLKNLEKEIAACESNLKDEVEKQRKYRIDDSRRTHNYDDFICTFLSMLAERGELTELVEQQLVVRRRQGIQVGRIHGRTAPPKTNNKTVTVPTTQQSAERKRRQRPKRRR